MEKIEIIKTSKNKECCFHNGYKYREERINSNLITNRTWRCTIKNCNGRLWTTHLVDHPQERGQHNHLPDNSNEGLNKMKMIMMKRARSETTPVPAIYREEAASFSASNNGEIPAPPFVSIHSILYNARHERYPNLPKDRFTVDIPLNLRITSKGDDFLIYQE
jgi:hypothetical protein